MFYMGGEQELAKWNGYQNITNSGRSSLRLIIESAQLQNKRVLLPDFLCEVIIDVLREYQVSYDFYKVNKSLQFELPSNIGQYSCLYLIKYFGEVSKSFVNAVSKFNKCIIVDDVFSPYPHTLDSPQSWYSFNSLRKISALADFSMLYSNRPLSAVNIVHLPGFSEVKYQAKQCKYEYLSTGQGEENTYLSLFTQGESCLVDNKGIYFPSTRSISESISFYRKLDKEQVLRRKNYEIVSNELADFILPISSEYYSFAPVLLANRDEVKKGLTLHNVYLAIHWPEIYDVGNQLSDFILSIPLDSRYSEDDMYKVCDLILSLINRQL
ncbi:MAG: hypothetical protein V7749_08780 [Cocleimonas sp.]